MPANIIPAVFQSRSSRKAAEIQGASADRATELQASMYRQARQDAAPQRQLGYDAVNQLSELLKSGALTREFSAGDLTSEPGYQFGLQQGQRGIENSAAARGMGLSGAALKAASRFNNDYAGTKYNEAFNRFQTSQSNKFNPLMQLAGAGAVANQQVNASGQNYANQAGQNIIGAGNAQAASRIQQGNIYANAWNQTAAQLNPLNYLGFGG